MHFSSRLNYGPISELWNIIMEHLLKFSDVLVNNQICDY